MANHQPVETRVLLLRLRSGEHDALRTLAGLLDSHGGSLSAVATELGTTRDALYRAAEAQTMVALVLQEHGLRRSDVTRTTRWQHGSQDTHQGAKVTHPRKAVKVRVSRENRG